jgi:Ca-activated chloride channel family protein
MERQGMPAGHVILLSDGHANHGLTDPEQLGKHAGELAARGVTSSCVGIGHGYSPLQLNAIAEAGRGQLHHSNDADEIVDVVLGELGEMVNVAAHSARLVLDLPRQARVQQLTRFTEEEAPHRVELDLGDIVEGRTRRVALMVRLDPRVEPGEALPFTVQLSWADSDDNRASVTESFELHLYREAVAVFAENDVALETLIAGLEEKEQRRLRERARRTRDRVSDEWSGPSKLMAFSMSRKHMRSESDHSGRNPEDWSDQTGD